MEIKKTTKPKGTDFNLISAGVGIGIILIIFGIATAFKKIADWGSTHKFVKQRVVDLQVRLPYRIEEFIPPEPVKEIVVVGTPYDELTSTEQKIIQVWKDYKTSMIAIAIFDCGESGLDPEAVSTTGDLGVAQIHFPLWKDKIKEEFGYTAIDMFDVDKNLEVAYWIWYRADGKEGDGLGSWEPWSGYNNGSYLRCLK